MSTIQLRDAAIQQRYYIRRAKSSISAKPFFSFTQVAWGNGFTSTVQGKPSVDDIPNNVTSIQGEFHRSDPVLTFVNDVIVLRATIAKGELAEGVHAEFTTLYLLDDQSGVAIVFSITPVWMNSGRGIAVEGKINIGDL